MPRPNHYGKLNWIHLPHEVQHIWRTRNDELALESVNWTEPFDCDDPCDSAVERADLVRKVLENTTLTPRERMIIELHCGQGWTHDELSQSLHVSRGRIHQIVHSCLRRLRHRAAQITDDPSVRKDYEVTTWRQWKWMQEIKRRDKAEGRR